MKVGNTREGVGWKWIAFVLAFLAFMLHGIVEMGNEITRNMEERNSKVITEIEGNSDFPKPIFQDYGITGK